MKLQNQQNIIDSHTQRLEQVQPVLDFIQANASYLANFKKFTDILKNADPAESDPLINKVLESFTQASSTVDQTEIVRNKLEAMKGDKNKDK